MDTIFINIIFSLNCIYIIIYILYLLLFFKSKYTKYNTLDTGMVINETSSLYEHIPSINPKNSYMFVGYILIIEFTGVVYGVVKLDNLKNIVDYSLLFCMLFLFIGCVIMYHLLLLLVLIRIENMILRDIVKKKLASLNVCLVLLSLELVHNIVDIFATFRYNNILISSIFTITTFTELTSIIILAYYSYNQIYIISI